MRQEFRELEILDEITKLRFEGKLSSSKVTGITRNELVHDYRKHRGDRYMPCTMHKALHWSREEPFNVENISDDQKCHAECVQSKQL